MVIGDRPSFPFRGPVGVPPLGLTAKFRWMTESSRCSSANPVSTSSSFISSEAISCSSRPFSQNGQKGQKLK